MLKAALLYTLGLGNLICVWWNFHNYQVLGSFWFIFLAMASLLVGTILIGAAILQ